MVVNNGRLPSDMVVGVLDTAVAALETASRVFIGKLHI